MGKTAERTAQQRLAGMRWRRVALDVTLCAVMVGSIIGCALSVYGRLGNESDDPFAVRLLIALCVAVFACYPLMFLIAKVERWLSDLIAPSWVIEACDGVVKVHGAVPFARWEKAKRQMLSVRMDYMPVDKAWERFGCTMAAIPATSSYLAAQQELRSLGVLR